MYDDKREKKNLTLLDSTYDFTKENSIGDLSGDAIRIEQPEGMDLTLLSNGGLVQRLFLPYPPKGRYLFEVDVPILLEATGNSWTACSTRSDVTICQADKQIRRAVVRSQGMLTFRYEKKDYILYAEEVNRDSYCFHNYILLPSVKIKIGRMPDNDLVYTGSLVSRYHAVLLYQNHRWFIEDVHSSNGVYVNGKRIQETELRTGDEIYIAGLRIIIGSGFISINDANNRVRISSEKVKKVLRSDEVLSLTMPDRNRKPAGLFYRYPRHRLATQNKKIEIEPPPMSVNGDKIPFLMRMGNSMVMGGTAALTGNAVMLATSVLLPVLSQRYTKEEKEEYEKRRVKKYKEYLQLKRSEILDEKKKEERILNSNYPPLSRVLSYAEQKEKLWERGKTDDDFLILRIGYGSIPLKAEIEYPKRRFEMENDALLGEMYELAEQQISLENVPILLDMKKEFVCGITGNRNIDFDFLKGCIFRLSLLYSYDEVKMVFLIETKDLEKMEFIRYLPHVWDDRRSIRFIATDLSEAYQISEYIRNSLGEDLEKPTKISEFLKKRPYYIVFALSKRIYESMEILKEALRNEKTCGLSIISMFEDVPKECSVLLELGSDRSPAKSDTNRMIFIKDLDKDPLEFSMDTYDLLSAADSMRKIANTRLKMISEANVLPKTMTFLEMFGVGRLEHLDIVKRWRENNPVTSLAVPVGVGTDGSVFMLDLHQKFQGPHGLVAGTTGSGKSEFLLTYILSLALNFHPDEVTFLLIDYKGGGLAGAFDDPENGIHLPHLVGTITNLDGAAISRSLISIQSEMTRRQKIFNEVKSTVGEGTMDIYMYQRLHRNKVVSEPMPHLFIISDEFAELKQQQPEFLDQLVSIARIGRSLGVHLILATQKPAGVVTDQIVSNTKFRVCLKVQDRADSMDMLKRPEAADIKETGRFYLQIGNNELFALGQSAWSGAAYEPQDEVVTNEDDSIQAIDFVGNHILEIIPERAKGTTGKSQLVSVVQEISRIARELKTEEKSLWLPALKSQIDIWSLTESKERKNTGKEIFVCTGILDDPSRQFQYPLTLNFETCNHILIVGDTGSGKTTCIQTILLSLVKKYTPEQINFYILDYSSRLLHFFDKLPHCGIVIGEGQEDYLGAFFKMVNQFIQERKKLFSELEVDHYTAAREKCPIPLILVVIDNLSGLNYTQTGQKYFELLQSFLKNSSVYGIQFLITVTHLNEAPMRIRQELSTKIALHMKDRYEYADALDCRVSYLPPESPGRGLYVYHEEPLEMQFAIFEPEKDNSERIRALKNYLEEVSIGYSRFQKAKCFPVISETETYQEFTGKIHTGRIPLGYSLENGNMISLPLKQFSMLSIYFGSKDSVCPVLNNILYSIKREDADIIFIKSRTNSCVNSLGEIDENQVLFSDEEGIRRAYQFIFSEVQKRDVIFQKICQEYGYEAAEMDVYLKTFSRMKSNVKPLFVIFERYADLCAVSREVDGLIRIFSSIYLLARRYMIYIIGCFYPDENDLLIGSKVYDCFNPEKLAMFFGGKTDRQRIVSFPYGMDIGEKKPVYNSGYMYYHEQLHKLFMPCGKIEKKSIEEDDLPIFG